MVVLIAEDSTEINDPEVSTAVKSVENVWLLWKECDLNRSNRLASCQLHLLFLFSVLKGS